MDGLWKGKEDAENVRREDGLVDLLCQIIKQKGVVNAE